MEAFLKQTDSINNRSLKIPEDSLDSSVQIRQQDHKKEIIELIGHQNISPRAVGVEKDGLRSFPETEMLPDPEPDISPDWRSNIMYVGEKGLEGSPKRTTCIDLCFQSKASEVIARDVKEKDGNHSTIQHLWGESKGMKRDFLLLKHGNFFTNAGLPLKKNIENIIHYTDSRSSTDVTAIFISINASNKSAQDFIRDIKEIQHPQDMTARLVQIISDNKSSQCVLVVGNKRLNMRLHESILQSISQIPQIAESQIFFLPESFTGTMKQIDRISAILEEKLLKLIPAELNMLEPQEIVEISPQKNSKSSSLISLLSMKKRGKQESQIINSESFAVSLRKVTKTPPMGTGVTQQLIEESDGQILDPQTAASREIDNFMYRQDVQGELDWVQDDQDSAYTNQIKRLLIRDCESGKGGGKLVPINGIRDAEEIAISLLSVLYQMKPSDLITGRLLPKVVFIASQNKRLEQMQDTLEQHFIKEATDPPFKLVKSYISKAQKQKNAKLEQQQHETLREKFDVNQVFVLLDRKFLRHLMHGDFDISEVDYLIFDEVHNIYPESAYVDIMNKFIFNSKMMHPHPGQLEDKKRLPKVLAFFSLDSLLQAAQKNDLQIMKKFYFMANTFNASLLCLKKQDLVNLDRDIVREFSQIRVRNIQDIHHLRHQLQNSQEFLQKVQKYLMFRRNQENRVACLAQRIIEKKKLQPHLYLETRVAKITLDEAMHLLCEFWAQSLEIPLYYQTDKSNILQKPFLESAQWVSFQKIRYFSSRILFDQLLYQLLGKDNINIYATKIIDWQQHQHDKQISWLYSPRVYLKKTQSESQAALEMCKILYKLGFINQYLKPCLVRTSESLQLDAPTTNQIDQKFSNKQPQYEEEKTQASVNNHTEPTTASSNVDNANSENPRTHKNPLSSDYNSKSSKSHNEVQNVQQMLRRVYKIIKTDDQLTKELEANDMFYDHYNKNDAKLKKAIKEGQHHIPIMLYNTRQLKLFIETILNPILLALNEYDGLCNTQPKLDLIRFDNFSVNMISESSIKDLLFQQCFYENQERKASMTVNETFIQFKNYRQRMFNIYDKNNKLIYECEQEFPDVVRMIDESLERYKFPHYMTKHVENYHCEERGKPSKSGSKQKEIFNRKTFLTMLMIALSDKEPTTMEFEKVKNEMGRLAFVGDSIIILSQVITMIFGGKKSFTEKDLDAVKNKTVKNENIKQRAQKVGLDYLKVYAKYYQKTAPSSQIDGEQKPRDLGDIIKSLAGLFSIYLGFGATYLLLSDFGIVEPPTKDLIIKIGKISVIQKVEILKTLSQNRKDLINYERDKKRQLFDILCNEKYPGLNKEPLSGTEIVEAWKKLVKSRGLFMKNDLKQIFDKQETADHNDDDSLKQLRDKSISHSQDSDEQLRTVSYSHSAVAQDGQIESIDHHTKYLEDEKSRADESSVSHQNLQNVDQYSALETASISTYMRTQCSKNSDGHTLAGDEEESKTGGQVMDEDIIDDTSEPNSAQIDEFERAYKYTTQQGYEYKNIEILMQSIVHKSYSEKLQNSGAQLKDSSLIDKDLKMQYNLQILEYLGDSILNFTISKLFYCETAESYRQWHGDFFVPTKLHELKTWFSSNNWLSFSLYENYYCTITEEIAGDPNYENSKLSNNAIEAVLKLKNKKISENEAIEIAPRVPLIYDQNETFQKQINNFNGSCFMQCLAADKNEIAKIQNILKFQQSPKDKLKVTSKSLSMKLFKDKDVQQQDQNEVDFSAVDENFVKFFSDVMEAIIGGIFMDSGDLDQTQMILLKLINCPSVSSFPIVQHDRTAVISVFNSKPYCKGIKLYHTLEEKDGFIYIMGYMGNLEFRRLKYSKERKKKVQLFYYDMRLYLEDAYKEFEMKFVQNRDTSLFLEYTNKGIDMKFVENIEEIEKRDPANEDVNIRNIKLNKPTNDEWLEFNKGYRKTWKVKVFSADQKRFSGIKEGAKYLYKFVSMAEENFKTRQIQNIAEMRNQIIKYLKEGLQTIHANPKHSLLVLESERVQSSRIRELLHSSDIKFIDCLSYDMKDVGDFIHKLNNRQVHQFYEHLIEFGKI